MSFADAYLQKHASGQPLIDCDPAQNLKCIVAIPAYNESGLEKCLDSLFRCTPLSFSAEVILLVNIPENCSQETERLNLESLETARSWMKSHHRDDLCFHAVYANNLPAKHFGAGLARKLVMDEAVRRFNRVGNPHGIILSLDADTTVQPNYIMAVEAHFRTNPGTSGCSIRFEHPKQGDEFPSAVYKAIEKYEKHLHYYLQAIRYTGYPYAYHTIGSCFAVKASVYCSMGGMSKRQAGEDFYFIQKVAMGGNYSECNSTTVYPSPRPSNRVPFGTGPEVSRLIREPGQPYLTFAPELFQHLKAFYNNIPLLFDKANSQNLPEKLHPLLNAFLEKNNFAEQLTEIRSNVSSPEMFRKRFLRKFNMFWILKYLHYAEDHGVKKVQVEKAASTLQLLRS